MKLTVGGETAEVRLEGEAAVIDGRRIAFRADRPGGRLEAIRLGAEVLRVRTARDGNRVFVWCAGSAREFRRTARPRASAGEASGGLLAPMPGRVRRIMAGTGQRVGRGDVILILEAMKMEHAIRAPREGVVVRVLFAEGDLVEAGAVLAEISQESPDGAAQEA